MKEQNTQLDDLFHLISRFIIVFPIVIVIFAVFLKFNSGKSQQMGFLKYESTPTPTKAQNLLDSLKDNKTATPSAKYNLTGPLVCTFSTNDSTINAYIKDKKISLTVKKENEVQNFLLNGDCLYIWKEGIYSGEKICGISDKIGIFEGLLSSGIVDFNFLVKGLTQILNITASEKSDYLVDSALNSCRTELIPTSVQFELPRNVLFKNKEIK